MLRTLGTILKWVILLPILIAVVLLAVANGQMVTVHLNPFDSGDPVLKVDLPLYQIGFILFVLGALIGGLVAWMSRLKYRRRERERREASLFQARAERPVHDRPEAAPAAGFLPRPGRG